AVGSPGSRAPTCGSGLNRSPCDSQRRPEALGRVKCRIDGLFALVQPGVMRGSRIFVLAVLFILATGCGRTFRGHATQPNPLAKPTETLRQSEKITIVTGDMELHTPAPPEGAQRVAVVKNNRYPLYNQASFTIVSRDRLRFHVQIDHKWQDWADLNTWTVHLE